MNKIILIFLFVSTLTHATNRDSLLLCIGKGDVSEQIYTYIRLEHEYRNNRPDSALLFANKAFILSKDSKIDSLLQSVYSILAINYKLQGHYDTTLYFFNKALEIAKRAKDSSGISAVYNNLGVFYDDRGERAKALDYFLKSLKISELRNDKTEIALSYNNIGLMYYKTEDFKNAEKYYKMSLAIKEELNDEEGCALLYNNLGILYYFEDKPQECIDYFKKAARIYKKSNNVRQTAMVLSNIGELYYEIGIYQSAMNYLNESQEIYKSLGDINGELYELNLLGQVYEEWGDDTEAIWYYQKAYEKALLVDSKEDLSSVSFNLYNIYNLKKNYRLANQYLLLYTSYKDSVTNIEKLKSMQELQAKYEIDKKEQEILNLNNINQLNEERNRRNKAEINKQKIFNTALIIGVFLILIVVVLIIRQNRIRKKNNELLMIKNKEIQFQHAEISEQKDEIEAQRDMMHQQKQKIEIIHKHVSQSIDYAQRIQSATLPRKTILQKNFSDYFVFFKPRDIVSGDFYWWAQVENETVITAADSTGHGVPGAFMSMLGMSFLKEIIVKEYITHPGVILRKLRKEIIHTLKQKGYIGEQKDGMDMALISFNHNNQTLQFAGANNPLYIITDSDLKILSKNSINSIKLIEGSNFQIQTTKRLYEIKPNKMPIAIYDKMDRFTTHDFQLKKGDQVYMFSDGYADQFGGPKGKKFKYKAFKKLLLENADKTMKQQKEILEKTLHSWMKYEEQVDDIVVLGIKI